MLSSNLALFLFIIFSENPKLTIVKLIFFDTTVSPPHKKIFYFFCSCFNEFEIFLRFFLENDFVFPDPEIK